MKKRVKKAQVSFEYIVIMSFVTIVIITILGISLIYSSGIKDRIRMIQVNNFGNKVVSSAESVFYSGEPSKVTIKTYLPENIEEIDISNNNIFISLYLSTGFTKIAFQSEVPIQGTITPSYGLKNIEISSDENKININDAS